MVVSTFEQAYFIDCESYETVTEATDVAYNYQWFDEYSRSIVLSLPSAVDSGANCLAFWKYRTGSEILQQALNAVKNE